ncbi:MAG: hypothetical protein ACPG9D_07875 [Candidatus Poseidoniaceae archaeon]
MNTNEIGSMMLLVVVALMTAKKTKFGQMTLRATQALEYLKTTPEPIRKSVSKIVWLHKVVAESENWEMPDWVMKNENYDWVAILFVADGLPLLVYQKSALRAFEAHLMKLESEGATVKSENKGKKLSVDLGDATLEVGMWRNPNGGKFAPFNVDFES